MSADPTIKYSIKEILSKMDKKIDGIDKKLSNVEKHVIKTNGGVKVNKWMSRTALTLAILALGFIIKGV